MPKKNNPSTPNVPSSESPANPAALANLRPHPETLKKGRTPPALTPQEIEFCRYRAIGFIIVDAGRHAGYNQRQSYTLMNRIPIKDEIEKQRQELAAKAKAKVDRTVEEFRDFAVAEHKHIARTLKSENLKVRHNRNGLEAVGMIQPPGRVQVSAQAGAASQTTPIPTTFRQRYKAIWLIEKEAEMISSFEKEGAEQNALTDGDTDPQTQTPA